MYPLDEITVIVRDSKNNAFSQNWKGSADRKDAIRWTLENPDLPYYLTGDVCSVEIRMREE